MFSLNKTALTQIASVYSIVNKIILKDVQRTSLKIAMCNLSVNAAEKADGPVQTENKDVRISKAMKAYLERAKLYDTFMKGQVDEYEIGRRHLANMMGEDPETFTQDDINRAVEYLMPSGLFEKKARPVFEHPVKLFPKRKEAEFDVEGRPFHCFFYTAKPNFYQALYEMTEKTTELNKHQDKMISRGSLNPDATEKADLGGFQWMSKENLEKLFIENMKDQEYEQFINCVTRLSNHPYSKREQPFLEKFCTKMVAVTRLMEVKPLQYDENNRPYVERKGYRKTCLAVVIARGNGTGKVDIDGKDISYFTLTQDREQILFPLDFTDMLNKVDIEAKIIKGKGHSAQAGAIRLGLARALCSFVSQEMVERMRLAGLLTSDPRRRERKKVGQRGARAKYTWLKR